MISLISKLRVIHILYAASLVVFVCLGTILSGLLFKNLPRQSDLTFPLGVGTFLVFAVLGVWVPRWIARETLTERAHRSFVDGFRRISDDPRSAVNDLAIAVALHYHPQYQLWWGVALEECGDVERAQYVYSAGYAQAPLRETDFRARFASCLSHLAVRTDRWDSAEQWADKAIGLFESSAFHELSYVRIDRGLARWRLGREADARSDFEWVVEHSPDVEHQRTARHFLAMTSWTNAARKGLDAFLQVSSASARTRPN